jgi:hypothetical protein
MRMPLLHLPGMGRIRSASGPQSDTDSPAHASIAKAKALIAILMVLVQVQVMVLVMLVLVLLRRRHTPHLFRLQALARHGGIGLSAHAHNPLPGWHRIGSSSGLLGIHDHVTTARADSPYAWRTPWAVEQVRDSACFAGVFVGLKNQQGSRRVRKGWCRPQEWKLLFEPPTAP